MSVREEQSQRVYCEVSKSESGSQGGGTSGVRVGA